MERANGSAVRRVSFAKSPDGQLPISTWRRHQEEEELQVNETQQEQERQRQRQRQKRQKRLARLSRASRADVEVIRICSNRSGSSGSIGSNAYDTPHSNNRGDDNILSDGVIENIMLGAAAKAASVRRSSPIRPSSEVAAATTMIMAQLGEGNGIDDTSTVDSTRFTGTRPLPSQPETWQHSSDAHSVVDVDADTELSRQNIARRATSLLGSNDKPIVPPARDSTVRSGKQRSDIDRAGSGNGQPNEHEVEPRIMDRCGDFGDNGSNTSKKRPGANSPAKKVSERASLFHGLELLVAECGSLGSMQASVLRKNIEAYGGTVVCRVTSPFTQIVAASYASALSYLKTKHLPAFTLVHPVSWLSSALSIGVRPQRHENLLQPSREYFHASNARTEGFADARTIPQCFCATDAEVSFERQPGLDRGRLIYQCKNRECAFRQWASARPPATPPKKSLNRSSKATPKSAKASAKKSSCLVNSSSTSRNVTGQAAHPTLAPKSTPLYAKQAHARPDRATVTAERLSMERGQTESFSQQLASAPRHRTFLGRRLQVEFNEESSEEDVLANCAPGLSEAQSLAGFMRKRKRVVERKGDAVSPKSDEAEFGDFSSDDDILAAVLSAHQTSSSSVASVTATALLHELDEYLG